MASTALPLAEITQARSSSGNSMQIGYTTFC